MKRFVRWLGAAQRWAWASSVGLAGAASTASAEPAPPPAAWTAYAELVRQALPNWLGEDTEANRRLVTFIDSLRPAPDKPTPPVALKIWIGADGVVSQVGFIDPAEAPATGDLQDSLIGRRLDSAPPKDLLWPIRLSFQLAPLPPKPAT
jgi:hypothetical protein